jgi:hypothetical protein
MTSNDVGTAGKKKNVFTVILAIAAVLLFLGLAALAQIGWLLYQQEEQSAPKTLVNDSVDATVTAAAKKGWIPCPGVCLKLATPGWEHKEVANFAPSDVWFTFYDSSGSSFFSQRHIGHIIQTYADKPAKDIGICKLCNGTGWVKQ